MIIATPADRPPLVRVHSALLATSIAEYFRDQGKNVLLLMDSLTRVSQAQREIALAIGEPPVTKGYPVSVFAKLPQLVERAGNGGAGGGSITAFYTVLTEGDDPQRSDRRRGASGARRPHRAVAADRRDGPLSGDRHRSVDQPAHAADHRRRSSSELIRRFRQLNAAYAQNRDLITIGAYAKGSDPRVDEAIQYWPAIQRFLQQDGDESISFAQSFAALKALFPPERAREVKQ